MNERIFELIQSQNGFRGLLWTEEDKQEFAELIVMECANIVYRTCQYGDADAQSILYEFDIDNARSQK